jgi:hypothetical protein
LNEVIRNASNPVTVDGVRYVTPGDVKNIEGLDAKGLWELGDKLLMYLNDAAEHATVTPGVRERGLVLGEARPGLWGYLARRFLLQFKMWPLAAYHQIWQQNFA